MSQTTFFINGQVISFVSLLMITAFIINSLYRARQLGENHSVWVSPIYIFLGLDALVAIFLTGYQMSDSAIFYAARRIFSLLALLFVFLTVFDFPEKMDIPDFRQEKQLVIGFLGLQILSNAGWLVLQLGAPERADNLFWANVLRNAAVPLTFLWLTNLTRRRALVLESDNPGAANTLFRFRGFFIAGLVFSLVVFLRDWLPLAAGLHAAASSYGWMILTAGTALIFLGFRRSEKLLPVHFTLIILLSLMLVLDLVAGLISSGLSQAGNVAEVNRLLMPLLIVQAGIGLISFAWIPEWLRRFFPEPKITPSSPEKPLSARQRDVMRLLASDLSNRQIAGKLNITERTVKHHISTLFLDLEKTNRYELAEMARQMIQDGLL